MACHTGSFIVLFTGKLKRRKVRWGAIHSHLCWLSAATCHSCFALCLSYSQVYFSERWNKVDQKKLKEKKQQTNRRKYCEEEPKIAVAHFAQRDNELVFKCFFSPIIVFPKLTDNGWWRTGEEMQFKVSAISCGVSSVILPFSLILCTVIFTLPHTFKYLSIPCQSCFAFSLMKEKAESQVFMLPLIFSLPPATAQHKVLLGRIAGNNNRGIFSAST